jgi:Lamin Tail Domain
MKVKSLIYFILLLFRALIANAQVAESFSDGDIATNPQWLGIPSNWKVNAALQLQSNNTVANSAYYLSTSSTLATATQWEFFVNFLFNTSAANYADIFLTASASDLTAASTSGYFVRIGGIDDEISLFRKSPVGTITKIIDGANGTTASVNIAVKIKVTRDAFNQWTLSRDITGTGNTWLTEGVVVDSTFSNSSFFGVLVKQSTASFFQRHFVDDILVRPFLPDTLPPVIQSVTVTSNHSVDLLLNESLDKFSSQLEGNYFANPSLGFPVTAVLDTLNNSLVHLFFLDSFSDGMNYQLTANGVKDLAGNSIVNGLCSFIYFAPYIPRQYDVVINEIMADPSPIVGLPNLEWIELKNTTTHAIDLKGWRIGNASDQSGPMPNFILLPDSLLIVCSSAAATAMSLLAPTISVTSFPSLDNVSGQLILKNAQNEIIHSVNYSDNWYENPLKKQGGWTLEMIDAHNPCSGGSNWKASNDMSGGTPGKKNAVEAVNTDKWSPRLLRAYAIDSIQLVLVFDEPLDSMKATIKENYGIDAEIGMPSYVAAVAPIFDRVVLRLSSPLARNKGYTVSVASVTDCVGNAIGSSNHTARVGLSEPASAADMVINEILFNPRPSATDYVEIYNRSNKILDLRQTYIANRNSTGVITSIAQLSTENNLFFPQEFKVITASTAMVKANYIVQNKDAFIEIGAMPSFNDDKGTVIILNAQGEITDELTYNEKWHFKLMDHVEGVALERIDYNAATQLADNWHSAATAVGYGTPTYKNSQYRINDGLMGELKLSPEIFSPDNDGQDDFATLDYHFPEPGYTANITIFNALGRPVRYLQKNALCGTVGNFRWDGLGEKNQQLAVGVYVIFTELFSLKGIRKQFKNEIVLARRTSF